MSFGFSDEQTQFRAEVRRCLRDHSPPSAVRRRLSCDGYDSSLWQQLSRNLGLTGVHIPEQYGGQGFSFVELGIALEEMGRALCCAPFYASAVLATQALLNGATEPEKRSLLPALAAGERIATLAWVEANGRWDASGIALTAMAERDGYRLNGLKKFVLDGNTADLVLVIGRTSDTELSLFAVDAPCAGLTRRPLETIDATRRQTEIVFENVSARLLGTLGDGDRILAKTLDEAAVALACEMVGGARALLESAVDYSKLRMQFGRPIGSFQAIKHKCADLLLEVELANAAACYAAAAVAAGDPELPALASLAKASASDAYMLAAIECIQIHGGVGFTWDNDTQLWFKRAKSSEVLLGDASYHRERFMKFTEDAS